MSVYGLMNRIGVKRNPVALDRAGPIQRERKARQEAQERQDVLDDYGLPHKPAASQAGKRAAKVSVLRNGRHVARPSIYARFSTRNRAFRHTASLKMKYLTRILRPVILDIAGSGLICAAAFQWFLWLGLVFSGLACIVLNARWTSE